jgi:hypothetical protein
MEINPADVDRIFVVVDIHSNMTRDNKSISRNINDKERQYFTC